MINVLQIGFGPLGVQVANYISKKRSVQTVAVVDIASSLNGKTLKEFDPSLSDSIRIENNLDSAIADLENPPDVAIITTVSALEALIPQVEAVAKHGIPVISTCEELSYPWKTQPQASETLDTICKEHDIACLGTGVNPGFLMDYLPAVMSSVCKDVEQITVERIQDATPRRVPFQKKIGAGLSIDAFKAKEKEGTLRHVGLPESLYLLANSVGFKLDKVSEELLPVISDQTINTDVMSIQKGAARGVEQVAYGYINGDCKIKMRFKAAIGEPKSVDRIYIKGTPSFSSEIDGGINGDIATCAIAINSIKSVLRAKPGLHTMADISVPGYLD